MKIDSEVAEWLALHRAHEGGVTELAGRYLNHGRPVAQHLTDAFSKLIDTGFLALGRSAPSGQRQVCVTSTGQDRYLVLCARHTNRAHSGRR